MNDVLEALHNDENAALDELLDFLRIPSVSAEPDHAGDVARCANWLADLLTRDGFEAKVEPTPGHPVVMAQWREAQGAPTILVYGHYDVQPATLEDGWSVEPFEPLVRDGLRDGMILGRGATDDKGQLFCHVAGARAHLRARGKLPVNLIFVFEGEEESGSENLDAFLLQNRDRLACDAVVVSDTAQYANGRPAVTYGLRGLSYIEVTVTGPNRDLHSGSFGGAAANPANALARMVGQLVDESGRVNVAGFYDDMRPLEDWERQAWAQLNFDEVALAQELGVDALSGEAGYSALERMWARPTLDVNGLHSGWTGEGAKTIIPSTATAKLSCRLVPDQSPDKVAELLERRLKALLPPGLTMEVKRLHGANPVLLPSSGWAVEAAKKATAAGFGTEPVFIREGGSIPVVQTFAEQLDAPVILLGFGRPDDRAHGPDERFHLSDFYNGMKTSAHLWEALGDK